MGGPGLIDGEEHPETDNYAPCRIVIDGVTYSSTEQYFQCAKTTNTEDQEKILNAGDAESCQILGQTVELRPGWKSDKVNEMYKGNLAKFQQNEDLRKSLLKSGSGRIIFIESTPFWNHWNELIIQRIRAELRQNGEEDACLASEIREAMDRYAEENK